MRTGHKHGKGAWFHNHWIPEVEVLPLEQRAPMPLTIPDEVMVSHRPGCHCEACGQYSPARRGQLRKAARRRPARRAGATRIREQERASVLGCAQEDKFPD